jgi:prepilin-type N-terminal cleavage/methylation domain-containing protein/prepilin-type processing-associated H-X9-DG protein
MSPCRQSKPNPRGHGLCPCSALTLIELLVVLAILAILAALLIPAADKVMERAKTAKCTSRLRGLGSAINLYLGENDGILPTAGTGYDFPENGGAREVPVSAPARRWQVGVSAYIPGSQSPTVNTSGMFHCPEIPVVNAVGIYGFNREAANRKVVAFPKPSRVPLLCCMGESGGQVLNPNGPSPKAREYGWTGSVVNPGPSPNHGAPGRCNWLFADGHVETLIITDPDGWPWNSPDAFDPYATGD